MKKIRILKVRVIIACVTYEVIEHSRLNSFRKTATINQGTTNISTSHQDHMAERDRFVSIIQLLKENILHLVLHS